MNMWGKHPAVYALEPANEPWQNSDLPTLKDFYRSVRQVIREINPDVLFVFHESFHRQASVWNDLFPDDDIKNTVLDTHPYMAFWTGDMAHDTADEYCAAYRADLT